MQVAKSRDINAARTASVLDVLFVSTERAERADPMNMVHDVAAELVGICGADTLLTTTNSRPPSEAPASSESPMVPPAPAET